MKNIIFDVDSYKLSHWAMYPPGTDGLSCYVECRRPNAQCVFFGLQAWVDEYLVQCERVKMVDVRDAAEFAEAHGEPFNRTGWELVVQKHGGRLPIDVFSVDEGEVVPSGHALVVVDSVEPGLAWLATYVETSLLRYVWYMSSVATRSRAMKKMMSRFWDDTCGHREGLGYALHDFGSRGAPAAAMGGAAHLTSFRGSDTIAAVMYAADHYHEAMAARSVPASEHSVHMAHGHEGTAEYVRQVLCMYAKRDGMVSIVVDAYDDVECAAEVLRQAVPFINGGATVVLRPDSGVPWLKVADMLELAWNTTGGTYNQLGFRALRGVKVLQGDGIDDQVAYQVLAKCRERGYAASNVVFGSGGWLLQDHRRDDLGWAYKASARLAGGKWERMRKAPAGDPGKASKGGRLLTCKHPEHGWRTDAIENWTGMETSQWKSMLHQRYGRGESMNRTTLAQVRERCEI